eukprot:CCRYP_017618-RF/>CCRYP_017618-RF protein AED:0.32 eAED:0.31 QI:0/0/0/1/0/0/2/0/448
MEVELDNDSVDKLSLVIDNNDSFFKNRLFLKYDDDSGSIPPSLEEVDDSSSDDSFFSAGNADFSPYDCFDLEFDEPRYNYHGPKIIVPRHECPVTICTADTIGAVKSRRLLRVLLDSGSTVSLIKRSALPPKVVTKEISDTKNISTLAGKLQAQEVVTLRDLRLPEFDKNRRISQQKALVFDNDQVRYDVILGTNFLSKAGIKLNYSEGKMEWFDCSLPLRPPVELIRIDNKTAKHIRDKFTQCWLCRYPRPMRCVHDKGGEFIGSSFQWLLELFSIKDVCSTSKNPQSNAVCERMHQTVGNVLRTLVHSNPPQNMTQARDIIDDALATAMHAMRTTVATTLGSAPGALAFSRDMFLNVPLIADWQAIARVREHHVNENLRRANRKRCHYDYAPGQQVLKKVHNPTKLGVRTEGPYTIERVHVNGNLTIQLRDGITERINIRRVLPYR